MFEIAEITDKDLKTNITLEIMNSLPKWFSPPEDILKKSVAHRDMPFFAAFDETKVVGFVALKVHNKYTVDMYNLGVLEEYHRQGIGHALLMAVESYSKENGYKFITVLYETDYLTKNEFISIKSDCEELRKMLSSTTKTINSTLHSPHSKTAPH